jgi:hypothetical protein
MHQEKKHETAINTDMHQPSEKVLSQNPELEKDIEDKSLEQSENLWTEEG